MAGPRRFGDLGLSILGLGTQYPPHALKPDSLDKLSKRFYPESACMSKVLSINRYTGIDQRSSVGTPDHPIVNGPSAPSITEINKLFMSDGVPLAVRAATKAMDEAGVCASQITHMVSTTCTSSANPGYDHFVARQLGLSSGVEKVLLHGIGCSGGLAALRTAANLCLGHAMRRLPARILVVALEISTTMVRSELDSINALQETRIGVVLFSDCASAVVLSNGIMDQDGAQPEPVYELLAWQNSVMPDTHGDLGFDVDPAGWKVVLSPRVPKLTEAALKPAFDALLASLPDFSQNAADFDWAMHPGGSTILMGAERVMGITPEHMRASYDTYIKHGNSSSATIFSVLDRLRSPDMDAVAPNGRVRDHVVGCAFGPGVTVEMCMLKRGPTGPPARVTRGLATPPETESEASSRGEDWDAEGHKDRRHESQDPSPPGADDAFVHDALVRLELD